MEGIYHSFGKEQRMDNGAVSYHRFLAGDKEGMVELIRDYKDGLTLYLNSFVNNISIAEELMEDTFVKLVVKKPKYQEKSSFKTWLYTVGRNVALDFLRKSSKDPSLSIDEMYNVADNEDVESDYIKTEQNITLHRAMQKLNPEYKQVLYLVYFENFDNAEAAEVMHKNRRQIENLIYRAKKALKSELEREGFVYEGL